MTISSEGNINTYAGDGADTTFEFTFPILDESHIEVEVVNDTTGVVTTQTITTHYTVSGSGNTSGSTDFTSGTVTFLTAPASGETVVLRYDVPITQAVDLQENDNFPAETIEDSLDKLAMTDSMQEENIERAIRLNAADTTLNDTIIKGVPGANKIIQVDSGGDDLEFIDLADISAHPVLDEDDMISDSAAHVATQQSIKAYVDANAATEENVEDFVGGMVTGNTETGIAVTYQDGDGTLDFVVSDTTVAGDSGSTGITPGDTLTIAGGTNATTAMSGDTLTINVDDAFLSNAGDAGTGTYTITGQLDVDNITINGNTITSTDTNGSITLTPDGTGNIVLGTITLDADQTVGAGQDNYVLTYDNGTGLISLEASSGGISNVVEDTTPQLGGNLDVNGNSIVSASAGDISITPDTTGDLILDGLKWPQADGTADYVIKTDGAGQLSFTANTGSGIANVVDDTTPQLGGQLDVNGNAIGDGTRELITFTEDASAVNHINIENEATGNGPIISAAGDDVNVELNIASKGDGNIIIDPPGTGVVSLVSDAVLVGADIQHGGDTDNKITFGTDTQDFQTGGSSRLDMSDSGVRLGGANARATTILDEDNMTSNSATALATQQSIKEYVQSGLNQPYDIAFNAGFGSDMTGEDLVVQTYAELVMTRSGTFNGEAGYIDTVATGAAAIVDVEKNGTTIYSTKPQFAISTNTLTAGTIKSDGTEDFVSGDRITFKVTQIGSTIAGQKLRFTVDAILT